MVLRHPVVMGTITVRRPGGTNQDGDPLPATDHEVPECWWGPQQGFDERLDGRDTVVAGYWLGGPHDADIRATDVVLLPGVLDDDGVSRVEWQVHGEIGRWKSPHRGAKVGFHCALRRWTG